MIFSNQELHKAFAYKSAYYNKVIFVNRDDGSFIPIKVDDGEWKNLNKTYSYEKWHEEFSKSLYFMDESEANAFYWFANFDMLKLMKYPRSMTYIRKIGEDWHRVLMEALPVDDGIYLFVKDLNKYEEGITDSEGTEKQ